MFTLERLFVRAGRYECKSRTNVNPGKDQSTGSTRLGCREVNRSCRGRSAGSCPGVLAPASARAVGSTFAGFLTAFEWITVLRLDRGGNFAAQRDGVDW